MPRQELPEEFLRTAGSPTNSSLSSHSSDIIIINTNYPENRTERSESLSSSTTNTQNDDQDSFEGHLILENNRHPDINERVGPIYLPIKLPTEPTLEELLKQVSGNGDVRTILQIKLRIISSVISLQRLPYFMPLLRCLNLEGSMLFSLRDLGCDLSSLVYLNVSRCGLKSLDGTNGLSTLIEFVADGNQVEDAGPCSNFPFIQKISLCSNKIKEFTGMMFLGLCNNLKVLDLSGNCLTQKANYRDTVKENITQLVFLDKVPFNIDINDQFRRELLSSEYQSGNERNGAVRRINASNPNESMQQMNHVFEGRPVSSSAAHVTHITIGAEHLKRPSTSDSTKSKYDMSVGEPVCGNIVTKARKPKQLLRTAWGDTASSSSSISSDSSFTNKNTENGTALQNNSSESLLESSRLWRMNSQENRERYKK